MEKKVDFRIRKPTRFRKVLRALQWNKNKYDMYLSAKDYGSLCRMNAGTVSSALRLLSKAGIVDSRTIKNRSFCIEYKLKNVEAAKRLEHIIDEKISRRRNGVSIDNIYEVQL